MPSSLAVSRDRQRARKAGLRARGLCPWCGKVPPAAGRTRCEPCLEIGRQNSRAFMARRRAFWKALGWCQLCGKRDAMPRQSRCGVCAEQQDDYKTRRKQQQQEHA